MTATFVSTEPSETNAQPLRLLPITVNLLPDEVLQARAGRAARRATILVLLGALLATGGWYHVASSAADDAAADLSTAQQQAAQAKAGSNAFASLTQVKDQISSLRQQLGSLTAANIDWSKTDAAIRKALPAQVVLTGLTGSGATANGTTPATPAPTAGAAEPSGSVVITGTAATKALVSKFVNNLTTARGLSDPFIGSVTAEPSTHLISFTVNINVTSAMLNTRFTKVVK